MSYCRWSSDNWRCDLYCYEGCGYVIHVAGRRRAGEIPDDRWADFVQGKITAEEYVELHRLQMEALERCKLVDIDLPHAGETFYADDLETFRDKLLELRQIGYNFPDYVLEEIAQEMAERDNAQ